MNRHFEHDDVIIFQAEYQSGTVFKSWSKCEVKLLIKKNQLIIKTKSEK